MTFTYDGSSWFHVCELLRPFVLYIMDQDALSRIKHVSGSSLRADGCWMICSVVPLTVSDSRSFCDNQGTERFAHISESLSDAALWRETLITVIFITALDVNLQSLICMWTSPQRPVGITEMCRISLRILMPRLTVLMIPTPAFPKSKTVENRSFNGERVVIAVY